MADRVSPPRIVSIDWDIRTLRVVHAHISKRGLKIDKLLTTAIPDGLDVDDPESMGLYVRRTLEAEGIATRHAIVDIPRDQVILKTIKLPASRPEQLAGMVRIQIAKELTFPVTEAVVDYAVAPTAAAESEAVIDVAIAAVRCERLEQYEATFAAAGLKLHRVGLRPYANRAAICALLRHAMPERVLFIDVRPTFMEIDILHNGGVVFSRSASVTIPQARGSGDTSSLPISGATAGEGDVADTGMIGLSCSEASSEEILQPLMIEVTRSIEAYRASDPGASIDHVVVGGDLGVEDQLSEAIRKRMDITAELYNPASTFGWEPDEGAGAAAFASSLGLLLGQTDDSSLHFDFLHPKKGESVARKRLRMAPMVATIVLLFLAAGVVAVAQFTSGDRKELSQLEEKITHLEGRQKENKKFLALVGQIETLEEQQLVWVDVMYDVFSQLPNTQEMVVNHLDLKQKDRRVTLKTKAKMRDGASGARSALESFHRDGRDRPRFKVTIGSQSEDKKSKYPFVQDLRIDVLDDSLKKRKKTKRSSRRG